MPDESAFDVISGGRDPDHRRAAPWRLLATVAAAVLVASGIAFRVFSGSSSPVPPPKPQASPSPVALAAPSMLHGTPLRPGGAPGTLLFLGGEELRLLNVREQAPTSVSIVVPDAGDARNPLGPDPAVARSWCLGRTVPLAWRPVVARKIQDADRAKPSLRASAEASASASRASRGRADGPEGAAAGRVIATSRS